MRALEGQSWALCCLGEEDGGEEVALRLLWPKDSAFLKARVAWSFEQATLLPETDRGFPQRGLRCLQSGLAWSPIFAHPLALSGLRCCLPVPLKLCWTCPA